MRLSRLFPRIPTRLTYLTDVEGNINYLQRWVEKSTLVSFDGRGQLQFNYPNSNFVFGGDCVDKGDGDLEVLKLLTQFKHSHPDDVQLIVGNRDINKTRINVELDPKHIRTRLSGNGARWVPGSSPLDVVCEHMIADGYLTKGTAARSITPEAYQMYLAQKPISSCQVMYLKWMLNETMGCGSSAGKPETFELRRRELSKSRLSTVTDSEVVDSYLESVSPSGLMTQYLKAAQVGAIVEDTLFIHGAVTADNMGHVPGQVPSSMVHDWIQRLNSWYQASLDQWLNAPSRVTDEPAVGPLHEYALCKPGESAFNTKQVIMADWFQGRPAASVSCEVQNFLYNSGIRRVITGHKPCGDRPLVVCSDSRLQVIVGDTSYSDVTAKDDNRGLAVGEIMVSFKGAQSKVCITGVDKAGHPFAIDDCKPGVEADEDALTSTGRPALK